MKTSFRQRAAYRLAKLSAEQSKIQLKKALRTVCLVFPNTYHVGMSNLAVHCLYSLLNSGRDYLCERSFCEEPLTGYSLENDIPLSHFDIVAFSLSFELDYPGILKVLRAARIPLRSAQRDERHPLVIAGGPCTFSNPEPISDFIDAFAVGEGEELAVEIMDAYSESLRRGGSRLSLLHSLSEIPGVYIPSFYQPEYDSDGILVAMARREGPPLPVAARIVSNLDQHPCGSVILTPHTEFANLYLLELGRGCRRGCRYCSACYTYYSRSRSVNVLKKQIEQVRDMTDRVGLVTSDFSHYPEKDELLHFLLKENIGFSVSSIRADAITDEILSGMKEVSQRTLTLAPEVASERLMSITGKKIPGDLLLRVVDQALKHGIVNFRLYFMIGFPQEEDEDVIEIVRLVKRVHSLMRATAKKTRKIGRLTISVNPFIPKPFTPMELEPFADQLVLSKRLQLLRAGIRQIGNATLISESPRMARLQCAFARGDRRAGALVESAAHTLSVAQAMRLHAVDIERYVRQQPRHVPIRPWNTIEPPSWQRKKRTKEGFN